MNKSHLKTVAIGAFLMAIIIMVTAPNPFDSSAKAGFGIYVFSAALLVAIGLFFAVKSRKSQ